VSYVQEDFTLATLFMIAVSGIPMYLNSIIPGSTSTIYDLERQGFIFTSKLERRLCQSWGLGTASELRLLYFPMIFIDMTRINLIAMPAGHPFYSVYPIYMTFLSTPGHLYNMTFQAFQDFTLRHLSYRFAVAKALAMFANLTSVPLYHLLGVYFFDAAFSNMRVKLTDIPSCTWAKMTSPWQTTSTNLNQLRLSDSRLFDMTSPNSLLVDCSGVNNPCDIYLSLRVDGGDAASQGLRLRLLIDNKFSSGGSGGVVGSVEPADVRALGGKVRSLQQRAEFSSNMVLALLVSNQTLSKFDRKALILSDAAWLKYRVLVVDKDQLPTFFCPTLYPLLINVPASKGGKIKTDNALSMSPCYIKGIILNVEQTNRCMHT